MLWKNSKKNKVESAEALFLDRIETAIETLANLGPVLAIIGEPEYDHDGNLINPHVEWHRLAELVLEEKLNEHEFPLPDDLLNIATDPFMLDRHIDLSVAKNELIRYKKDSSEIGLTDLDTYIVSSLRKPELKHPLGFYCATIEETGPITADDWEVQISPLRSADWASPDVAVLIQYHRDDYLVPQSELSYFVEPEVLTPQDMPFIRGMLSAAEKGRYAIPLDDTIRTRFVVQHLNDLSSL